jgi:molybdenum cofactor guanylyltransferase
VRAAILAGGQASRFAGKPKGLERVGGERILDRVVQAVQVATGQPPLLVANAPEATEWIKDLDVVRDKYKDCGTLGGLYTAVAEDNSPVLVVAWDMPFITVELLEKLIKEFDDCDVLIPASDNPTGVEPLCAVYGPACKKPIKAQLKDEDYRASGFLDAVKTKKIPTEEIAEIGDPEFLFFNVNTSEELSQAEEMWRSKHE